MYTRSLGWPDNPAVVFLHGFMGSGEDWLPIAEGLSRDFYCLLPDLPGHGDTRLDPDPGYETWSAALKKVLLAHGIERTRLIGYSLGGRIGLYFSLNYPEIVTRLALESANPGISDPQERQRRAQWDDTLSRRIIQDGLEAFLDTWYDLPLFESLNRQPELKAELRRQRARQSPGDMAAVLKALSPGRQPDLTRRLAEIQAPTLLITGRLDLKYSQRMQEMDQAIPTSQLILLNDCGHNVHRERPKKYLEQMHEWLMPMD